MQSRTKRLWGRDVDIVKNGLNEQQVTAYINELMLKYRTLVERQDHFLSLGTLSEKAALEADRMAADIRTRAKDEADTAATGIMSQAKQRAGEMLANAKKRAHELTRSEADALLEAARRKADLMETEAKQRAQLYLIRSRAVIEDDLKQQFIEVYEHLLSALRELLGQGHDIESGWKGKIVELWKREKLELDTYDAVPSILVSEIARSSASRGERETRPASRPDVDSRTNEADFSFAWRDDAAGRNPDPRGMDDDLKDWTDRFAEKAQGAQQEPLPGNAADGQRQASYQGSNDEGTEPVTVATKTGETVAVQQEVASSVATAGQMEGEVDISLLAPVDLSVMSKLYTELQSNREVKILRTVGSYDKGTIMTVLLERPTGLVEMLSNIPGVEIAPGPGAKSGSDRVTIPVRTQR